jgi:nucleotide-binding universal stress UspA family protein
MITLKNVLVATDFGEASESALVYGRALARNFGATLHVVHVIQNAFGYTMAGDVAAAGYTALMSDLETAAQKELDRTVREDDRRELNAKAVLMTSMHPAQGVVQYARDESIDLIVMGTHGRGPFSHILMGSVAERVVRTAPCPVLTVRHPEHEFVRPDALVAATHTR